MTLTLSYWIAVAALTLALLWGIKMIARELQKTDPQTGRTVIHQVLLEKDADGDADAMSFSRVAGSLGATSIAAAFVGIGYWLIYALYFNLDMTRISQLGTYFLAGSAMFLPYAFNQLSKIFK